MNFNQYAAYEDSKQRAAELKQAKDAVEKTKMNALSGMLTLCMNWNDPKMGMQMFSIAFQTIQYLSAHGELLSVKLENNKNNNLPSSAIKIGNI